MARLRIIDPQEAQGKAKELLAAVRAKLSITPNMMRVMANSPAVLQGYLAFAGALEQGSLDARLREAISLAVAQRNGCGYCLSAHSVLGQAAGLTAAEIAANRKGESAASSRTAAALRFARLVVERGGNVSEDSLDLLRAAGFGDGEIAEIVANVALNVFTNYFNLVAATDIDFPVVPLTEAVAAR